MQAHAEHQQRHADLGELEGDVRIGGQPWREGPDRDAREQIANDRRQTDPARDEPGDERSGERDR